MEAPPCCPEGRAVDWQNDPQGGCIIGPVGSLASRNRLAFSLAHLILKSVYTQVAILADPCRTQYILAMSPVGVRIRELRETHGWSQTELANHSGVRQATISDLESGKAKAVSFSVLERLSKALDCSPGYLIVEKE
jgi:putative transcriptional regulator